MPHTPPPPPPKTHIISISGPTASGKTTLARLLRQIFDGLTFYPPTTGIPVSISTTILHLDDFYYPEHKIPLKRVPREDNPAEHVEQADWDCPEAIDFDKLKDCLQRFRHGGCSGAEDHARILSELGITAVEEGNSVGPEKVTAGELEDIRNGTIAALLKSLAIPDPPERIHLLILEGFLLYFNEIPHTTERPPLLALLDAKILLHTTLADAVSRRKLRMTYVTIEGFFDDPPGYVEGIVWPNYVKYHCHLFVDGDVGKGRLTDWARLIAQIRRQETEGMPMRELVGWAAGVVVETVVCGERKQRS